MKFCSSYVILLSLALSSASVRAAIVLQVSGQVISERSLGSIPVARGENSESFRNLNLPQGSRVQLQFKSESLIEAKGPATFDFSKNTATLRYGEFLLVNVDGDEDIFFAGNEISPNDATVYVRLPMSQEFAEVYVLNGSAKIGGAKLLPGTLYLLSDGQVQKNPVGLDSIQSRIEEFEFSKPYLRSHDKSELRTSMRYQLSVGQSIGINKFRTESGAEVVQDHTITYGFQSELIHKRYFDMPSSPERRHFLKSPAFRLGAGLALDSAKSNLIGNDVGMRYINARALVGLSWLGLSIDAVGNYLLASYRTFGFKTPYGYGVRAQYEFDLFDVTKANLLVALGYSYHIHKMEHSSLGLYQRDTHAIHMALAFVF